MKEALHALHTVLFAYASTVDQQQAPEVDSHRRRGTSARPPPPLQPPSPNTPPSPPAVFHYIPGYL